MPIYAEWPCPLPGGNVADEMARVFGGNRQHRLLVIPPLFDEHNKLRHQLTEIMRRLDLSGIDSVLPDLPGQNESTQRLVDQSIESWRDGIRAAIAHFKPTRFLSVRAGALLVPVGIPGWDYAPMQGQQVLRGMIRARIIAAREAGREETTDALMALGRSEGLELAGWKIGPEMFGQLENAQVVESPIRSRIEQSTVGGKPLWLRAEPDNDPEQADALAAVIAIAIDSAIDGAQDSAGGSA